MEINAASLEKREKITHDLKTLIREAEDLLKTKGGSEDAYQQARARVESALHAAREGYGKVEESVLTRSREVARNTDQYVHNHAWQSVGIGALAGLVIGLLAARR